MSKKEKEQLPAPEMSAIEKVLIEGDLSKLTTDERVFYYNETCKSLGLNPLSRPFEYIKLNGKLQFYARKDCTEQLRSIRGISITKIETRITNGVFSVIAYASDKDGRTDVSTGAVQIENLKGDNLANALMKAETKAKRRVTLSIAGLGWLDETEIETIADAKPVAEAQVIHDEPAIIPVVPEKPKALGRDFSFIVDDLIAANNEKELKVAFAIGWKELKGEKERQQELKSIYDNRLKEITPRTNGIAGVPHVQM